MFVEQLVEADMLVASGSESILEKHNDGKSDRVGFIRAARGAWNFLGCEDDMEEVAFA